MRSDKSLLLYSAIQRARELKKAKRVCYKYEFASCAAEIKSAVRVAWRESITRALKCNLSNRHCVRETLLCSARRIVGLSGRVCTRERSSFLLPLLAHVQCGRSAIICTQENRLQFACNGWSERHLQISWHHHELPILKGREKFGLRRSYTRDWFTFANVDASQDFLQNLFAVDGSKSFLLLILSALTGVFPSTEVIKLWLVKSQRIKNSASFKLKDYLQLDIED